MHLSQETLLTQEQLRAIAADSKDVDLKNPLLMHIRSFGIDAIRRVSAIHDLVLVQGNEHTGLTHIMVRHSFFSLKRTWQNVGEGTPGRLDDPSRFRPDTTPEFDYVAIADEIYACGVIDVAGNHRPDIFDKYVGDFTFSDGTNEPHVLLLYKGTRVIHTLFPKKSTHNRKSPKGFSLVRGASSTTWQPEIGLITVTIPYYGPEMRLAYALVFEFNSRLSRQDVLLWAYNAKGQQTQYMLLSSSPHLGLRNEHPMDLEAQLQYADLRWWEQAIKDTENGNIQRLRELP